MRNPKQILLIAITFFLSLHFIKTNSVFAQKQPDISISPSLVQLDLSKDAPETEISYTNNSDHPISLHVIAKDFSAIDDNARFDFLEGQDAKDYHYSLTSWIHIDTNDIVVNPHDTQQIKITIDKQRITIGGHYASILTEIKQENSGKITVHAVAATLLFVRTGTGNEQEQGSINQIAFLRDFLLFPDKITLRFENSGNVQVTPYGLITIKDMFGTTVATAIINDASSITLPESIRKYTMIIHPDKPVLFPGMYTADISLHFGQKNKQIHTQKRFFVINNHVLLAAGIIVIALIVFGQFRYGGKKKSSE